MGADTKVLSAISWCIEQAENIMTTTAGCASSVGDTNGVLQYVNSMASDIAINLQMAEEAIETRQHATEAIVDVLAKCSKQFAYYNRQHLAKNTPEANAKAMINHEFAAMCDAALAKVLGEKAL